MLLASEIFTCAVSFVLPVILAAYFCYTLRDGWKWLLYGALCYVLLGMLAKLSVLTFLNSFAGFSHFSENNPYGYALLAAFLDAVLISGGTWLIMKVCARSDTSVKDALDYGTGLAGMASLLLVGVNSVQLFLSTDIQIPASTIFFAGLERFSMLVIQMAWSVWMLKSIQNKKKSLFFLAFGLDFAINALAVVMNAIWQWPIYASNLLLVVVAAGMLYSILPFIAQEAEANRKAREAAEARIKARAALKKQTPAPKPKPVPAAKPESSAADSKSDDKSSAGAAATDADPVQTTEKQADADTEPPAHSGDARP